MVSHYHTGQYLSGQGYSYLRTLYIITYSHPSIYISLLDWWLLQGLTSIPYILVLLVQGIDPDIQYRFYYLMISLYYTNSYRYKGMYSTGTNEVLTSIRQGYRKGRDTGMIGSYQPVVQKYIWDWRVHPYIPVSVSWVNGVQRQPVPYGLLVDRKVDRKGCQGVTGTLLLELQISNHTAPGVLVSWNRSVTLTPDSIL